MTVELVAFALYRGPVLCSQLHVSSMLQTGLMVEV